ncbi:hypothetical protein [Nonomuraea dietziae]|uniref:Uncharacterized protein n=1 Tax=Nonomuraea dietziae TaxID=65515 RepID=A0A7W5VKB7_9ACTN|nr:hypothetical protein [Nonomuraea dietziae]MBB3733905.1 hypothetical protein [Nonomuraea dietziae]
MPEGTLITVEVDAAEVERRLRAGEITCPSCAGVLTGWGFGRRRRLWGMGEALIEVQPRRTRCSSCARTHVLLQRADGVEVVGTALEAKAQGAGIGGSPPVWAVRRRRFGAG